MDISTLVIFLAIAAFIAWKLKRSPQPVIFVPVEREPLPDGLEALSALAPGHCARKEDLPPSGFAADWVVVENHLARETGGRSFCPVCGRSDSMGHNMLYKGFMWPRGSARHIPSTHMPHWEGQMSDADGFVQAESGFVAMIQAAAARYRASHPQIEAPVTS